MDSKGEIALYQSQKGHIELGVKLKNDTVWLSMLQMTKLFKRDKSVISRHIRNIFKEAELSRSSSVALFATDVGDGRIFEVEHYNLDVVISVGYRVKSKEGVLFRQWSTRVLKEHILNGYTINKDRLTELENMYHFMKDTLTITSMNINRLRIDSARQKDFVVLLEDVENIKREIDVLKKSSTSRHSNS